MAGHVSSTAHAVRRARLTMWGRRVFRGGLWMLALAAALVAAVAFGARWFPLPRERLAYEGVATLLLDREGRPLRVVLGRDDLDQRPTYVSRAGDWIGPAIIAAEDRRFREHGGVDAWALARAVAQNLGARRTVSGASTLSMQVIRLVEPRPRTPVSKAVEAVRAIQLEAALSKQEILDQYLNRAPFGGNMVGIEAASRRYFGVSAANLSLAQASLLAGLPQGPSRLRPDRHPERARRRQAYVLERMVACGFITETQRCDALAQPVAVRPAVHPHVAPHFTEAALARLEGDRTQAIRTTLDARMQAAAEAAVRRGVASLPRVTGGAAVVLDVRTGAVRALVGSPDPQNRRGAGQQVNAALARRSPGSALKPFAYAMAFDEGWLTPATALPDAPRTFGDLAPANFDGACEGFVSAREALTRSLNLPALEVAERLTAARLHARLTALGLRGLEKGPAHHGLGLVLGNAEVTLLDLANAYACLARGGVHAPLCFNEARAVPVAAGDGPRLFSAEACWMMAEVLGGEDRAGQGDGHRAETRVPRAAWKTGTSSGFRDAWAVAYNPDYVVGVWLGNPDGSAAPELVGTEAAVPVARDIFRRLAGTSAGVWFPRPPGVAVREVCAVSGQPPGPNCPTRVGDWHQPGVTLQTPCGVHAQPGRELWPEHVTAFLEARRLPQDTRRTAATAGPRILTPRAGAEYRRVVRPGGGEGATLVLEAAGAGRLHWFVNGVPAGTTAPGSGLPWSAPPGRLQVVCADETGRRDRVEIVVR